MADEVVHKMQNFSLHEEEEDLIVIEDEIYKKVVSECHLSLVGKLLTGRRFNHAAMKETIRRAWGPKCDVKIFDVGENLFHFRFSSEANFLRVLNGGPWSFDNHLLALMKWEAGMKDGQVCFTHIDFWVQIWGLPFELVNPLIAKSIGKHIGEVLAIDDSNSRLERGRFLRVRVRVPLDKPLKRGNNVVCGAGNKVWVDYKYERLSSMCSYCGWLGHEEGDCTAKEKDSREGNLKPSQYGTWLCARMGRGQSSLPIIQNRDKMGEGCDIVPRTLPPNSDDGGSGRANVVEKGAEIVSSEISANHGRDSGLIDLEDNTIVNLNGKEMIISDLVNNFPISKPQKGGKIDGLIGPGAVGPTLDPFMVSSCNSQSISKAAGPISDMALKLNVEGLLDINIATDAGPNSSPSNSALIFSSEKATDAHSKVARTRGRGRGPAPKKRDGCKDAQGTVLGKKRAALDQETDGFVTGATIRNKEQKLDVLASVGGNVGEACHGQPLPSQ
ncbi:hypothetical protein Vadar_024815 [Vaccinium darrowii]|uniref:Uncharacterized protein n=1 Tax=Vaccinium darrowii TaxID=229202 RepID=A0ACB7Z5Z7_9ERIC|nr:hypothetical protein Vadar_024815 [Vaccinium darrowii]